MGEELLTKKIIEVTDNDGSDLNVNKPGKKWVLVTEITDYD